MNQMVTANIALDVFGIVLSLIPVVYLLSNHRYKQRLNQYFLGVCISNIFMIIGDLADWIMQDTFEQHQKIMLSIFTMVFYVASAFVLYFFARYINEYLKLSDKLRKGYLAVVTFLCSVQVFFAVISPFTGSVFLYNRLWLPPWQFVLDFTSNSAFLLYSVYCSYNPVQKKINCT